MLRWPTILAACDPFELWTSIRIIVSPIPTNAQTKRKRILTHGNPIAQRKRDALRFAPNSDVPDDGARFRTFDAEIGKRVFAYETGPPYGMC